MFFVIFVVSEQINERRRGAESHVAMDQFRLQPQERDLHRHREVRPGNSLCSFATTTRSSICKKALEMTHTGKRDMVVMTVQVMQGPDAGYQDIAENQLFTRYEQLLFSRVTAVAEKAGKHVDLLVVPGTNVYDAIVQTAMQLDSADIWAGRSSVLPPAEQARLIGDAWERLPRKPSRQVTIHVVDPAGPTEDFAVGAHAPRLADADVDLIHALWLDASTRGGVEALRHREIVSLALARLADDLHGPDREQTLDALRRLGAPRHDEPPAPRPR